jgi:NADPH:quinone reductase-like Zn-dependent oxidoreductase
MGITEYGPADVLHPLDLPVPEPGPGEVRIRVRASGVNPIDGKLRAGTMAAFRPVQFPYVPGIEAAGVVDAVGPDVTGFQAGDPVMGSATSTYGEYAIALADRLAAKPDTVAWESAAALPVAAETAFRCLKHVDPKSGETLLVHGAAGGVGSMVTTFAVADGVRVIGTASEANHDYLRTLGAIPVVYGEGWPDRVRELAPDGVQAVVDTAGRGVVEDSAKLIGGPDRVVTIADPTAQKFGVTFSTGVQGARTYYREGMARALELLASGALTMPLWKVYPLAEAAAAQRESEAGHLRGKIVLVVEG